MPDEPPDGADSVFESTSDYPGRAILGSPSSRVVLERLIDGDPLELEARCRERMFAQAYFIDPKRLLLRVVARVAYHAPRYRGEPRLDDWLISCIDESLGDLVDEDREAEASNLPPTAPWDPRYAFISEILGVEPALARRACLNFNMLPIETRRAFFAIAVEGKSIHRYVAEGNGPPQLVRERLDAALRALGRKLELGLDDIEGGA